MFYIVMSLVTFHSHPTSMNSEGDYNQNENVDSLELVDLSKDLLLAIQERKSTIPFIEALARRSYDDISNGLQSDDQKLAFWINIYNAFIQISLTENPEDYQKRNKFFDQKRIHIGGKFLSFNDIEHGIIRKSQWLYGLGRIKNPFAPDYHRDWGPSYREPRIHFALNCGAKSCPPVAIYSAENLEAELNYVTQKFLSENTELVADGEVRTTVLFSWFRGDFGGKGGIKKMLSHFGVISKKDVKLIFADYDWTLCLDNFVELP